MEHNIASKVATVAFGAFIVFNLLLIYTIPEFKHADTTILARRSCRIMIEDTIAILFVLGKISDFCGLAPILGLGMRMIR